MFDSCNGELCVEGELIGAIVLSTVPGVILWHNPANLFLLYAYLHNDPNVWVIKYTQEQHLQNKIV